MWGATGEGDSWVSEPRYFNPRAPCGARRRLVQPGPSPRRFQSTRPVWGATPSPDSIRSWQLFQSTRPVWGATLFRVLMCSVTYISIHAPRVGRDTSDPKAQLVEQDFNPRAPCGARRALRETTLPPTYFNPRAPCGARLKAKHSPLVSRLFQSTRPVWGATAYRRPVHYIP